MYLHAELKIKMRKYTAGEHTPEIEITLSSVVYKNGLEITKIVRGVYIRRRHSAIFWTIECG